MMIQAVLSNPSHPEYGVATIPFPINLDGPPTATVRECVPKNF